MIELPFMPVPVGDLLTETGGLTTEELGAYMLLLMHMWAAGGELPADTKTLRQLARLTPAKWRRIETIILSRFVDTGSPYGSKITHSWLRREYERVQQKRTKAAVNGRIGGRVSAARKAIGRQADGAATLGPRLRPSSSKIGATGSPPIPIPINKGTSLEEESEAARESQERLEGDSPDTRGGREDQVDYDSGSDSEESDQDHLVPNPDRLISSLNRMRKWRGHTP